MLETLRDLFDRHLALLRAELGAIARDAATLLAGAVMVASLLVGAFTLFVGALVVGLATLLFGSPLFGVAALVLILLSMAAWIPVVMLNPERGRRVRRRAVLPALAVVLLASPLAVAAGLPASAGAGVAALAGIATFGIALLLSLREIDRDALADRFYPHVSAEELRRTLDAADALRTGRRRREHD